MRRLVILVPALIFIASSADALPRFASRTGGRCQSCHINPSGGGMRQPFGVQYGREKLPVASLSEEFEIEDVTNLVTNVLGAGADVRTLYYYRQLTDTGGVSNNNALWQMQGDIYLNFRVAKKVSIYFDKGLYSGFEVFGLLSILPANGYIKVGKFTPNYGTKLDDHTTFIRGVTGFSPESGRPEHTGLEVGFAPGGLSVTGGFYNASDGFGGGTQNAKALLGRLDWMTDLNEDAHISLGANVFRREESGDRSTMLLGGMGALSVGNFTVLGEADIVRARSAGTTTSALVLYVEGGYPIVQGFDLKLAYDFYDPDTEVTTGSYSRYSLGFEFFPINGVEVRPMYRLARETPSDGRNNEFHLLVHFYI